jgi:hypothetical protein
MTLRSSGSFRRTARSTRKIGELIVRFPAVQLA